MDYRFLDNDDARLLEFADKPVEGGVVAAVRSTGYAIGTDEALELALVDMDGNVLFDKRVLPQNVEDWPASEASGGVVPADVADLPELYQYEDEVVAIAEKASTIVAAHLPYVRAMVSAGWVSLPDFDGQDVVDLFCASHSAATSPGEPATAASLADIAAYYGVEANEEMGVGGSALAQARLVAACYRALVAEHAQRRDAKGRAHWDAYWERVRAAEAKDERASAAARMREHRFDQMNGLLWVAGGIIFISLVIQLYQRGGDVSFMVVAGAAAVFCLVRAVANFRK